ncbi:MAG: 2,3-bisphosphoglycerate-dependent phosphoglycerate mutase [Harvfovirus sp.]|uniref:2,3-bisphosphoglycerate-dependent phosphoglycerate mutase n=1 Tax=Harvfovirus sp. TaxID=2487768 RepID=A0A3G5A0D1_9VIRU|nr:MAG: 2,3-bisphosphoglycerate-dependent phosphoglycerate mutase [Harvfovirus sp.]
MVKEIYYIRHGESIFNANPDIDDTCGDSLTEKGKLECEELAKKLAHVKFDHVIVSPLLRALQTLKLSKVPHEKAIIINECREYKQNKCDFLSDEAIIYETENDIMERITKFKSLLEKYDGRIAVFTHADFIFYATAEKIDDEYFGTWLNNAEFLISYFM